MVLKAKKFLGIFKGQSGDFSFSGVGNAGCHISSFDQMLFDTSLCRLNFYSICPNLSKFRNNESESVF